MLYVNKERVPKLFGRCDDLTYSEYSSEGD